MGSLFQSPAVPEEEVCDCCGVRLAQDSRSSDVRLELSSNMYRISVDLPEAALPLIQYIPLPCFSQCTKLLHGGWSVSPEDSRNIHRNVSGYVSATSSLRSVKVGNRRSPGERLLPFPYSQFHLSRTLLSVSSYLPQRHDWVARTRSSATLPLAPLSCFVGLLIDRDSRLETTHHLRDRPRLVLKLR